MSDPSPTNAQRIPGRDIPLPNGDTLIPRKKFAGKLGVTDKTAQRMKLPTIYVGNVAHVPENESLAVLAARIQRQPKRRGP